MTAVDGDAEAPPALVVTTFSFCREGSYYAGAVIVRPVIETGAPAVMVLGVRMK